MSQTEDYNLGESLSESSEDCSVEVKGEASIEVILAKLEPAIEHTSQENVAASHEEQTS